MGTDVDSLKLMISLHGCLFCIRPESTQREHIEVANDRKHDVESEVLFTLLDVSQVELLTSHFG